ncbi:MAG: hypothetical protein SFV15_13210 [Polyangiaceae bacterium]|nr:hypothetical protein [Polyangiaceae bacterium]
MATPGVYLMKKLDMATKALLPSKRAIWARLTTLACAAGAAFSCSDDASSPLPTGTGGTAAITGGASAKSGGAASGGTGGAGVTAGVGATGGAAMAGAGTGGASGGANGASGGQAGAAGLAGAGGASGGAPSSTGGAGGQAGAPVAGAPGSGGQAATSYTEFSSPVPVSPTEADRFFGVTFDPEGRVYATGYVVGGNGDSRVALVRFLSNGNLDTGFGTFGVVTLNTTVGAGTTDQGRSVRVQSDGRVVVAGYTQNASNMLDRDVVVARFTSSGTLDTTFGNLGLTILDINAATPTTGAPDTLWDMDLDATDRIVLFGVTEALDIRTDQERFVARLTKDGALDTSFAAASTLPGVFTHDLDALGLADQARGGFVQADGKILASGYTPVGGNNEVVLVRLNDNGTPDPTFSGGGVVRSAVFPAPGMAEAYGAVRQSDGKYVTTGYGREAASPAPVDLVSFRYGSDGAHDTSWNGGGALIHNVGVNDRGRNLLGLPDDRIVMVGTATPVDSEDAMVVLVRNTGALETTFGTIAKPGYRLFDFGGADEEFYGVALSPDKRLLAIVGYRSGGVITNDDATLLLLPVP